MKSSSASGSLGRTVQIVAAYVARNHVARAEVGSLIDVVFGALSTGKIGVEHLAPSTATPKPAVPIKKSITPDVLICLEDGKGFKSMKRHLATHHDLSPDQYRCKWNLPSDYPMVAANYAAKRSALAIRLGLGRASSPDKEPPPPVVAEVPKRRAPRKSKADVTVAA